MVQSFSNPSSSQTSPGYRLLVAGEVKSTPEYFHEARDMFRWLLDNPTRINEVQAIQFREGESWITAHQDFEIRSVLATRFKEGLHV